MPAGSAKVAGRPLGLTLLLLAAFAGFTALGSWQMQRMQWKHDLIARVTARVRAAPVALPPAARLSAAAGAVDYLRVRLSGVYAAQATTLIAGTSELGMGYWAMTPMQLDDGRAIWINRGFVPAGTTAAATSTATPAGRITVTGLVRASETGGSLLRANQPQANRWYTRDVAALCLASGIATTAPVFVDAQVETPGFVAGGLSPVPGLTTITFPDNHQGYALTWFAMAALSLAGIGAVWRRVGVQP